MNNTFSKLQIIFLLLLAIGISNHVLIIPHLLRAAGRDAWISILFSYLILIVWSILFYFIIRSMNTLTIREWTEQRVGKFGYWLIAGAIAFYLVLAGMMIVYDTTKNVSIYFLTKTHPLIIIFCFIFVSYKAASGGLKTLVYSSTFLLPIVWMLGIGVSLLTKNDKHYGMLLPVLTNGFERGLHGSEIVLGGCVDLIMLLLLQQNLRKPMKYRHVFILLTLLIGLIIGPTIGSITAFGPTQAENLRFPAFEQWRLVMIGGYISHVDFLAVFQLLAGSMIRTALIIFLLSSLLGGQSQKPKKGLLIVCTLLVSSLSIYKVSDIKLQDIIQYYFYSFSFWFGIVLTATLVTICCIPKRKEQSNESHV